MKSKYIKNDPIPWLTDGENPAVTFLVENEILGKTPPEENYSKLLDSYLTDYFRKNFIGGAMGDFKHPDLFYRGSVWFFLLAVESGYKYNEDFVALTADNLCKKLQLKSGGFGFNYQSSDAVGCRTGNMIYSLLKSGVLDTRTSNGINWITENQRSDGGWLHCPFAGFCDVMKLILFKKTGNGLKHENDIEVSSCPVASYYCLKALVEADNPVHKEKIKKGAAFFIQNDYFIKSKEKLFCGNRVNYENLGYPVMSQYDYLSGMILVAKTKTSETINNGELFNSIIKKQNGDGSWNCENKLQGMIIEKYGKSRWVTLNSVRFITLTDKQVE